MGLDADSNKSLDEKVPSLKDDSHVAVSTKIVDTAAELSFGDGELDSTEALRIRKKIDYHILPLMCILYWIQFMDKTTLGSAAILGIRESTHLTTNEYNWLGTVFYISYLVFEFPQNLALQRFPVGKWMSFGTLHIKTAKFASWQWLMIITGIITFLAALSFWSVLIVVLFKPTILTALLRFLFPDSPTNAWFLSKEERVIAVRRIKVNQTGVENKHFKKEQMVEALLDPKTWLFALFSALDNVPNSLTNQRQLITSSFGFTTLQTTLLGCVDGVVEIVTIWSGVTLAATLPNSRAWVAVVYSIPNILGVFLINFLPWENKVGLLFAEWLTGEVVQNAPQKYD
ncbi:hypothetical protein C0991_007723 [Blastosporella zonata]|nr:hypothetical protein C0991_007723 [Blastosporella zonata]